jgi:DNA-binding NarL/FixJ family response regulator
MRSGPLIGALIAAHLGEFERARELLDNVAMSDDKPGLPEALRARVLVALGDAEEGVAAAQAMIDNDRRLASVEENDHEAIALVEGLHALGEWDRLRAFLPDARRRSASLAILGPVCDRAEGMVASADGDTERAIELLREALAGFERLGVPYEVARTKTLLGTVMPDGDAMLAEAITTAESLLSVQPAASAARATPAKVSPDGNGLTERELEILALIGEGISNQEIADQLYLSLRTVERHVSNIYLKLGLVGRSSRAAAASYAVRSGLGAGDR